jgi:hypothetical protein
MGEPLFGLVDATKSVITADSSGWLAPEASSELSDARKTFKAKLQAVTTATAAVAATTARPAARNLFSALKEGVIYLFRIVKDYPSFQRRHSSVVLV